MMDWATGFYSRQYEWLAGDEAWEIQDEHRARAAFVQTVIPPPALVLELGAGGGQTSGALADLGYDVVANELLPEIAAKARQRAAIPRSGTMTVCQGNYYDIDPGGPFDIICYWDGFGIGNDADQRVLLIRIRDWLAPAGRALIELYTPWYWSNAAGRTTTFGSASRRYGFDPFGNRMLDTWWSESDPGNSVTQSLRCYAPADLELLLEGTGLRLVAVEPGGYYDPTTGCYEERAPPERAMSYVATLAPRT